LTHENAKRLRKELTSSIQMGDNTVMKKDRPAVIYFLINDTFEGKCIKIGRTLNLKTRIRELSKTGLPLPFRAVRIIECLESEYCGLEAQFHHIFREARINEDREFFAIDVNEIDKVLQDMAELKVYCSEAEYDAAQVEQEQKAKASVLEFWCVLKKGNQNNLLFSLDLSNLVEGSEASNEMRDVFERMEEVTKKWGQNGHQRLIASNPV
jgi:hypothetical protein